jgi:phage terminase large subunit-like protein
MEGKAMMDKMLLNDKNEYPSDAVLAKCLGKTKAVWDEFVARSGAVSGLALLDWRFYNDGKTWLTRLMFRKKTVCWISVWDEYFKTAFYFTEKSDSDIRALKVDEALKAEYFVKQPIGKLKPFTVPVKAKKTLADVFALIGYKISLK